MKKIFTYFTLLLIFISSSFIIVNADCGPKPSTIINISGIEGKYYVALASKEEFGPNRFYDPETFPSSEFNEIVLYSDSQGYKFLSFYKELDGNAKFSFQYYAPEDFKVIIYQNGVLLFASDPLERYAFSSYFDLQYENNKFSIKSSYDYASEIFSFILRILATLIIEMALFFLFKFHIVDNKFSIKNLLVVLITNLFTQIVLNVLVNIVTYYNGSLEGLLLFINGEVIVFIIEIIIYQLLIKKHNKLLIFLYTILANILSCILTFIL